MIVLSFNIGVNDRWVFSLNVLVKEKVNEHPLWKGDELNDRPVLSRYIKILTYVSDWMQ